MILTRIAGSMKGANKAVKTAVRKTRAAKIAQKPIPAASKTIQETDIFLTKYSPNEIEDAKKLAGLKGEKLEKEINKLAAQKEKERLPILEEEYKNSSFIQRFKKADCPLNEDKPLIRTTLGVLSLGLSEFINMVCKLGNATLYHTDSLTDIAKISTAAYKNRLLKLANHFN